MDGNLEHKSILKRSSSKTRNIPRSKTRRNVKFNPKITETSPTSASIKNLKKENTFTAQELKKVFDPEVDTIDTPMIVISKNKQRNKDKKYRARIIAHERAKKNILRDIKVGNYRLRRKSSDDSSRSSDDSSRSSDDSSRSSDIQTSARSIVNPDKHDGDVISIPRTTTKNKLLTAKPPKTNVFSRTMKRFSNLFHRGGKTKRRNV